MIPVRIVADVVWPALFFMERVYTWWAVATGLIVEYVVLRAIARVTWRKAAIATVAVNAASALVGLAAIPLIGFAWEALLDLTVYRLLHAGTFNPFGWISTVFLIGGITGFVEYLLLTRAFKVAFKVRHAWFWWWMANCASVFLAFVTMLLWPVSLA